jgi:arylsulfatase A-like enzyme
VFFSDNGPTSSRWCGGLRGRKVSTDDGGARSVCCVRWLGRIRPGTRIPQIAGAIDLLPTLAALAGVALGPTQPLDGLDLAPLLLGTAESEAVAQQAAARTIVASFGGKVSVRSLMVTLGRETLPRRRGRRHSGRGHCGRGSAGSHS